MQSGPVGLGSDVSIVRCTLSQSFPSPRKLFSDGGPALICLESDDEEHTRRSEERNAGTVGEGNTFLGGSSGVNCVGELPLRKETGGTNGVGTSNTQRSAAAEDLGYFNAAGVFCWNSVPDKEGEDCLRTSSSPILPMNHDSSETLVGSGLDGYYADKETMKQVGDNCSYGNEVLDDPDLPRKSRGRPQSSEKNLSPEGKQDRKNHSKEEKERLKEERKRKRQEDKLQREELRAQNANMRKVQKEKERREKGKFALKSIVAEIDAKVAESGAIGGHLLSRLAEKGLSYRITTNPAERSILWKMSVPDDTSQSSSTKLEVPYVAFVYEAEEFCNMIVKNSLLDHISKIQKQYPSFTVCYITNRLMSYISKRDQNHYKNASKGSCWTRPPIEEVLAKLTTHFTSVHSRLCLDEADLADHVVGLTSNLATCLFRKKLTWLSINANGSLVPKGFIDKDLIKKNSWLKSLVAIPKVHPRQAIAIWKRYPTMRSLLSIYLNPSKSVHEKEFLLKDLPLEADLGREDRRVGELCSKRVYRLLMAKNGHSKTSDVEDGADFFGP